MITKKVKIIMIDAFKPSYLKYAPYLSSLTKKYQWGELEMPPGHEGGVEIVFKGKSNKLALFYKKDNSSLKFIKYFSFLEKSGKIGRVVVDALINLPRFIRGYELFRTGNIPLKQLWKFDFSIKKPLNKIINIKYKYFGEIDRIGHKYGTKSEEIVKTIKDIDKKISKEDFNIIFSDHGMIDIKKIISVPWTNECFIDSDMARYWGDKEELNEIKKKLPINDGKIINWKDKSYGNLIFITKPGILILPNYWQGNKKVKAMHGYYGKNKEIKGIYILNIKGKRKDLKARKLHKIINDILKEDGRK